MGFWNHSFGRVSSPWRLQGRILPASSSFSCPLACSSITLDFHTDQWINSHVAKKKKNKESKEGGGFAPVFLPPMSNWVLGFLWYHYDWDKWSHFCCSGGPLIPSISTDVVKVSVVIYLGWVTAQEILLVHVPVILIALECCCWCCSNMF